MNKLQKIFVATPLLLATALTIYVLVCRQKYQEEKTKYERALNKYSMLPDTSKIVDKVELGSGNKKLYWGLNYRVKDSALELICNDKGNVLLVMKEKITQLTIDDDDATLYTSFRVENGEKKGKTEIEKVSFLSTKHLGTMVSSPLSHREMANLIKAWSESKSNNISIALSDRAYPFIKRANLQEVKHLITKCSNNK